MLHNTDLITTLTAGLVLLAIWSVAGLWQFPETLPRSFTASAWIRATPQIARPLGITLACGLLSTLIAVAITLLCLTRELQTGRAQWSYSLLTCG